MEKLILMLTMSILCSIVTVDCLQCYVCNECPTVNDKFLVNCGGSAISTTKLPTTLTTTTQTTSNETTTTVSNITTSAQDTTNKTNATTPMTTAQTLTNTTTTPTPPVSVINTTSAPINIIQSESRTRKEISKNIFGDNIPGYRASNTTLVFYCFLGTLKVNTTEKIVRGCASKSESSNRTICNDMATDPTVTSCRTCTTDKCNTAFPTQISILLLIIATPLSIY